MEVIWITNNCTSGLCGIPDILYQQIDLSVFVSLCGLLSSFAFLVYTSVPS